MAIIEETARAKVNLTLRVLGRRSDGFHQLESLVAFAHDAADRVTLNTAEPAGVTVEGPFAPTIAGENLVAVTLRKLADAAPALSLGHVTLEKRLPVAAGIGGGSADAAAVLRAVRRANPALEANVDWHGLAASLGADVPVCLLDRAAFMTGIGERLAPLAVIPEFHAVLVNPLVAVPADKTGRVFRALAAPPLEGAIPGAAPPTTAAQCKALVATQGNDLEKAARSVVPEIAAVLAAVRATPHVRLARLSGAGPTCIALYDDGETAMSAARSLTAANPCWWIKATKLG